jgi:hypothetical protein
MTRSFERVSLWGVAIVVALVALTRFGEVAGKRFEAPYDIGYETPGLRTIQLIREGRNIYAPEIYDAPTFWITLYTPLYHYIAAGLPTSAENPFLAGRIVALVFMLAAGATVFAVGGRAVWAGVLAFGTFFLIHNVITDAVHVKNDPPGLFFSALAVVSVARARHSRKWVIAAGVASVAAFFSKQYFIAAPAACFLWLLRTDRAKAFLFGVFSAPLLGVAILAARLHWGPGFTFSVFRAMQNPMTLENLRWNWALMFQEPVFVFLLAASLAAFVALRRRLYESPYPCYWLCSFLTLGMVAKVGAVTNYFFELVLVSLLWLVFVCQDLPAGTWIRRVTVSATAILAGCTAYEMQKTPRDAFSFPSQSESADYHAWIRQCAEIIRGLGKPEPRLLNLAWATLSDPLPGEILMSDPPAYMLFYQVGLMSPEPLLAALERREYDGVLVPRGFLAQPESETPVPALHVALRRNYYPSRNLSSLDYLAPLPRR